MGKKDFLIEENEEMEENEIKIDINKSYIREGGNLRRAKKEDGKKMKDKRCFVFECLEDGLKLYDFDATDARPFFKDLLNRQGQFLEVKLLYGIIIFCLLFFLMIIGVFFMVPTTTSIQKAVNEGIKNVKIEDNKIKPIQIDQGPKNIRDVLLNK